MTDGPLRLTAELRTPGDRATACRLELEDETFSVTPDAGVALRLQYRDVEDLAVSVGAVRIALVDGTALDLGSLGAALVGLVGAIRERRTRQRLADRLVRVPSDPLEVVEAAFGGWHGLAHLVRHPWGLVLSPFDLARDDLAIRRADIAAVDEDAAGGRVTIEAPGARAILMALGQSVPRVGAEIRGLRQVAEADAGRIVESLLPTAGLGLRRRFATTLIDGHPIARSQLGADWAEARTAFVAAGDMAASLDALDALAGPTAEAWLAVAPTKPGADDPAPMAWLFSAFPGVVAMEVATSGAHATYFFRTGARDAADPAAAAVVAAVSDTLVDLRFLREPIALPDDRLAAGGAHDYRRAVAAIPSLRDARSRFLGRIVHDEGWEPAVRDLLAFVASGAAGGWPGRAPQEARVAAAGGADDPGPDASDPIATDPAPATTVPQEP